MANAYASNYYTDNDTTRGRSATISTATTVEGDKVTWVTGTAGAHITIAKYDRNRASEYIDVNNPIIIVKNTADCSGGATDTLVKSEDGVTLHTFDADNSVTPAYVAIRLVSGNRNTASWEVA